MDVRYFLLNRVVWLALSGAGAIYSWSYDHVLLFVPIVIACGVLAASGRERAASALRYRDFSRVQERIEQAHAATADYLRDSAPAEG